MSRFLIPLVACLLVQPVFAHDVTPQAPDPGTAERARWVYEYAYPLISMDATMRQATNVPNVSTIPMRAPVNQFAHARTYPSTDDKDVVRFNFDTLYSLAWIDVAK
jgi:hypothetical protein